MAKKLTVPALLSATALSALFAVFSWDNDKSPLPGERQAPVPVSASVPFTQSASQPSKTIIWQETETKTAAPRPAAEKLCPVSDQNDTSALIREMNYRQAQSENDPVVKFTRLANSLYEAKDPEYAALNITRAQYQQDLQNSAHLAFSSLRARYPHSLIQMLDQTENIRGVMPVSALRLVQDIHDLRWSMTNLVIKPDGTADIEQGYAIGGYDKAMLQRVIAKLTIDALPEAIGRLKAMPVDGPPNVDKLEEYWVYLEIMTYAGSGNAYSELGKSRPDWAELGFTSRREWVSLKNSSEGALNRHKDAFAKIAREGCSTQSAKTDQIPVLR